MKKYTVILDAKTPEMYTNTLESVHIAANNYQAALKAARRLARRENMVVVYVRVIK